MSLSTSFLIFTLPLIAYSFIKMTNFINSRWERFHLVMESLFLVRRFTLAFTAESAAWKSRILQIATLHGILFAWIFLPIDRTIKYAFRSLLVIRLLHPLGEEAVKSSRQSRRLKRYSLPAVLYQKKKDNLWNR